MSGIPGVVDLQVEQQVLIPQIRIRVKRDAATRYGFDAGGLVDIFETALNGKVISQVIEEQRFFDLVLWTPEYIRKDVETIRDLRLVSPSEVNSSELDVDFWTPEEAEDPERHRTATGRVPPNDVRPRGEVLADIRQRLEELPGIFVNIGQPISQRPHQAGRPAGQGRPRRHLYG